MFEELWAHTPDKDFFVALTGAAVTTVGWLFAVFLVRWVLKRLRTFTTTRLKGLRIQQQELVAEDAILSFANTVWRWIGFFIYLALFYVFLTLVGSYFPLTQEIADRSLGFFLDILGGVAESIVNYLPNIAILLIIYFVTKNLINIANVFFRGIARGRIQISGFYPDWAKPTYTIVKVLLIVLALVISFPYLPGHESPAFQAVSLFIGFLVSLGSAGAVANIISGIALTYMRAFQVGDRVKIADTIGDVTERSAFITRIRTPKNIEITIPNGMVMNNHIVNFSAMAKTRGMVLHATVTIGYDVPWREVHELLIGSASATDHLEEQPAPFVLQTSLDDFYVSYELNAYTRDPSKMPEIYSQLFQNIQDRFHEAGVEIASPHLSAVRDGNSVQIPDDYLPKDYNPPAFRLGSLLGAMSAKPAVEDKSS